MFINFEKSLSVQHSRNIHCNSVLKTPCYFQTIFMSKSNKKKNNKQPKQRSVTMVTQAAVRKVENATRNAVKAAIHNGNAPKGGSRRGNPSARRDDIQKVYSLHIPMTTECLGQVSTATNWTNTDYVINPSNILTFPRLSKIAANFEMYDFKKLVFRFVSSSATAVGSTNTALGTIMMNTNYDVLDGRFNSQIQMEDYGGIVERVPSRNFSHVVNVRGIKGGIRADNDSSRLLRYNLHGTTSSPTYPANSSAHDYDVGRFQIASIGAQTPSAAGRLYVDYSLDLHRWKTESVYGQSAISAHLRATPAASASSVAPWGTNGLVLQPNSTLAAQAIGTAGLVWPVVGRFLAAFTWNGTGIASAPSLSHGANLSPVAAFNNGTAFSFSVFSSTVAMYTLVIDVLFAGFAGGNTTNVSGLSTMSSANADVWISDVPSNLAESPLDDRDTYDALVERMAAFESSIRRRLAIEYKEREQEDSKSDYEVCCNGDDIMVNEVLPEPTTLEPQRVRKEHYLMTSRDPRLLQQAVAAPKSTMSSVLHSLGVA
jgi:hypothetical protein